VRIEVMTVVKDYLKSAPGVRASYRWLRKIRFRPTKDEIYDRQIREVMRRVLRPDSTYLDVGANVGAVLAMAVRAAPAGRHFAVEALPHLAAALEARFPSVTVLNCAVGREPGRTQFHHVLGREAYSGLRRRVYDFPDPVIELIEVDVRRLDDLIPADMAVELMKIDIEGGELDALAGGVGLLSRSRPPVIFEAGWRSCNEYGVGAADFSRFFSGLGYAITSMERWLASKPPYDASAFEASWRTEYNFLAVPV
jgi:FkbM family methyltransferase